MWRPSSSRWAAPNWARIPGGRIAANSTSSSKPDAAVDQAKAQDDLRAILSKYPGMQSEVVTFLGDRISESLSGETAQVAVKVFGDDLDALDAHRRSDRGGARARNRASWICSSSAKAARPPSPSNSNPRRWRPWGCGPRMCSNRFNRPIAGETVGQTFNGTRTVDAVLLLPDALRHQPEQLGKLMIAGPLGAVPLSQVARI